MPTGKVLAGSDLQRKTWLNKGLVDAASLSFWAPYTGMSSNSIVYQENNESAKTGHTVVFDFSGKISGKAIKGKNTAYGKGEIKRKFSDKITVDRYRIPVSNGDAFDGVDIGDLTINAHTDSRAKLADLFIRFKDQMIFDSLSGALGEHPTHIYNLGTTYTYNQILLLETAVKTGKGFKVASATGALSTTAAANRAPLTPFRLEGGDSVWLHIVDSYMATKLKTNSDYQTIVITADVRGNGNRALKAVVGRLGKMIIVEAQDFFGYTEGAGDFTLDNTEIEIAGIRQYATDGTIDATTPLVGWSGQAAYDTAEAAAVGNLMSRGYVLGAGAVQLAFGKMPDYKLQESEDFAIDSESAIEFWNAVKKTKLSLESGEDYKQAKIADVDFGCIAVDIQHA